MELEPRHIFFILFLSVTLMLLGGIGDGIIASADDNPANKANHDVFYRLEHGKDLKDRIGAIVDIFTINYDWLTPWLRYPFMIINIAFGILILRQLWKLVPIVGR